MFRYVLSVAWGLLRCSIVWAATLAVAQKCPQTCHIETSCAGTDQPLETESLASSDFLSEILTEVDTDITSELNLDPLGMLVVWSTFGQAIFQHRISSVSHDVRNFTLNLFNHWVIKTVVENDSIKLGKNLHAMADYANRGKESMAFKQACLIYLENLFVYSVIDDERKATTAGVVGISKARQRWSQSEGNPRLLFSHTPEAHVLVRQHSLGVAGRYKTPFVEMGFFDRRYDYATPNQRGHWTDVEKLARRSRPLAKLHKLTVQHMTSLVSGNARKPSSAFRDIDRSLRAAFVNAFKSPKIVGEYSRDFWLATSKLDQGAAGALGQVINKDILRVGSSGGTGLPITTAEAFNEAKNIQGLGEDEQVKLKQVQAIEPFLGEMDLLFTLALSAREQTLGDIQQKWAGLGRDGNTLPQLRPDTNQSRSLLGSTQGLAKSRLQRLLGCAESGDITEQVSRVIDLHSDIMSRRGQSPWVRKQEEGTIHTDVRVRDIPHREDRPVGSWIHEYYLPQFRNLLSGFGGQT